jgi:hypothetical protein
MNKNKAQADDITISRPLSSATIDLLLDDTRFELHGSVHAHRAINSAKLTWRCFSEESLPSPNRRTKAAQQTHIGVTCGEPPVLTQTLCGPTTPYCGKFIFARSSGKRGSE